MQLLSSPVISGRRRGTLTHILPPHDGCQICELLEAQCVPQHIPAALLPSSPQALQLLQPQKRKHPASFDFSPRYHF